MATRPKSKSHAHPPPIGEFERADDTKPRPKVRAIAPKPPSKPTPPGKTRPRIAFRVFARASGIRPEHLAGFARYIEGADHNVRKTMEDWREAYESFRNRPILG